MTEQHVGRFDHEEYLAAVRAEAGRCAEAVANGDPDARVPGCPDWDLAELCRHLGLVHRWVTRIVGTRSRERVGWDDLPDPAMPDDPKGRADWLLRGAHTVTELLAGAGTDTPVWGWAEEQHTGWWGRRMAHETLVHRIDAEQAAHGRTGPVDPELAADNIDELLHNAVAPAARAFPRRAALRDAPGTLHLHCDDAHGEWLLRPADTGFDYERGHRKADTAVRGPALHLLLLLNGRLPEGPNELQVFGAPEALSTWLDGLTFD